MIHSRHAMVRSAVLSVLWCAGTGLAWSQAAASLPAEGVFVHPWGVPTKVEGSWEGTYERRNNFDLRRDRARDRRDREQEVKLSATSDVTPSVQVRLEAVGLYEASARQGSDTERSSTLGRGETWVRWTENPGSPLSVQVGRISLSERRAWWWDEDLDAVRVRWDDKAWGLDAGWGREVARVYRNQSGIDPVQRGVSRFFGQGAWRYADRHSLDGFWLLARDGSGAQRGPIANEDALDASDLRASWLGARASGEIRRDGDHRIAYWADAAWVRGTEAITAFEEDEDGRFDANGTRSRKVRGHALDLGATWTVPVLWTPRLSVGLARGSGGIRNDAVDHNFRQTGLQENRTRMGGIKRMYRYGQLLRPELSNLQVVSLGAGLRVTEDASVELVWHRLRQVSASDQLAGSRLSADPDGSRRDIGREIDLLLAWRSGKNVELTLGLSRFKPGRAFSERDAANGLELGVTLGF
jgi:alginate production protein